MVGRQHQQLCVFAVQPGAVQGGSGDGRSGVAANGFEDVVQGQVGFVQLAELVLGAEEHFTIGHGQDSFDIGQPAGAGEGLLQQALAIGQAHERLGHGLPGDRPQAGAGAASDDARDQNTHLTASSQK
ncbi:hypothetical protein D3C79_715350 [compost metagenome]